MPAEKVNALENFLAIEGNPDMAAESLRFLASETDLDLNGELDSFEQRLHFIAARGLDLDQMTFAAAFTRNLDYYTGFVFEAGDPARIGAPPAVGGGRYDGLLAAVGAKADIPAVGAAVWIDRLDESQGPARKPGAGEGQ